MRKCDIESSFLITNFRNFCNEIITEKVMSSQLFFFSRFRGKRNSISLLLLDDLCNSHKEDSFAREHVVCGL